MATQFESASAGTQSLYKNVFVIGALYDIGLGAVFLLLAAPVFKYLIIPLPENMAYLRLCAAFVIAQGVGYWYISGNMVANRDLAKVGVLCKLAYAGVAAYTLAVGQLPHVLFAVFGVCDVVFAVFFLRFISLARPA